MASQAEIDLIVNATNTLRELQSDLRRIVDIAERTAPTINLRAEVDKDGSLKKFTSDILPKLTSVAGSITKIGGAALAAAPNVGALATGIANIIPAAAVATTGMLAAGVAAGTLKLGLLGVGDAVADAFDPSTKPDKLKKELDALSPSARKFVLELVHMKRGFKDLQLDVQENLFKGLSDQLKPLSSAVLPGVRTALESTATSFNHMARGAIDAAKEIGKNGTLDTALRGATKGIQSLEKIPGRVVTGFGQLAAAAAPAFDRITAAADRASAGIADKLTAAFESGALDTAINNAVALIKELGGIGLDVLSGLRNIFTGLTTDGQGLFSGLQQIGQAFKDITENKDFQTFLQQLALTGDSLVKNVLPLLEEAIAALAPALAELGPPLRDFFDTIGPPLQDAIRELAPVLMDVAVILKDQLPVAALFVKGALEALIVIFKGVDIILRTFVIPALRLVADVFQSEFVTAIADGSRDFADRIGVALGKFQEFRDGIAGAIATVTGSFGHFTGVIMPRFVGGVRDGVDRVIQFFRDLPGMITSAIGDLGGILFNAGASLISGFIDGIESKIAAVASVLLDLTSKLPDWKGPEPVDKKILFRSGQWVIQGFQQGIASQVGSLQAQLAGVTGSIPSFVGGVGGGPGGIGRPVSTPRTLTAPQQDIIVQIGNDKFDRYIATRVRGIQQNATRTVAQGVRR